MTTQESRPITDTQEPAVGSRHLKNRLEEDETVEATTIMDTRSLVLASVPTMLSVTIPLGVIIGGLSISLVFTGADVGVLAVLVAAPAALFLGLSPVMFAYAVGTYGHIEYAITDQRFIRISHRIVTTSENSIPVEHARGIELNEGFLDRILGTGDIKIGTTHGKSVTFENIPNSEEIYRLCQQKIEGDDAVDSGSQRY